MKIINLIYPARLEVVRLITFIYKHVKFTVLGESYMGSGQDGSSESKCSPPGFDSVVHLSSASSWSKKDNANDHADDHANASCLQLPSDVKFATLVTALTLKSSCLNRTQDGKVRGASGGSRISQRGNAYPESKDRLKLNLFFCKASK